MRLSCKKYKFGKNRYYFHGQICMWRGVNPAIVRIDKNSDDSCYRTINTERYNSLHYSNLRPATKAEIKKLGKRNVLRLK